MNAQRLETSALVWYIASPVAKLRQIIRQSRKAMGRVCGRESELWFELPRLMRGEDAVNSGHLAVRRGQTPGSEVEGVKPGVECGSRVCCWTQRKVAHPFRDTGGAS